MSIFGTSTVVGLMARSRRIFLNSETVMDSSKEETLRKEPRRDRTRASFNEAFSVTQNSDFANIWKSSHLLKAQINVAADLKTNPSQTKYVKTDSMKNR